jgi:hypothetical protein
MVASKSGVVKIATGITPLLLGVNGVGGFTGLDIEAHFQGRRRGVKLEGADVAERSGDAICGFQTQEPASARTQASNYDNFFISRVSLAKSSAIFSARSAR